MSFFAQNPDEAARFADRLIFDAKTRKRMLAAQNAELPKDAASAHRPPPWSIPDCLLQISNRLRPSTPHLPDAMYPQDAASRRHQDCVRRGQSSS